MVIYQEKFLNGTDEDQPYSVESEKTHKYSSFDGAVENGKLCLKRPGVRQLLVMPEVTELSLKLALSYAAPAELAWFKEVAWGIYFGYDRDARTGYQLVLSYKNSEQKLEVKLNQVDEIRIQELSVQTVSDVQMQPEETYPLSAAWNQEGLQLSFLGHTLLFEQKPACGVIALSREAGVREVCFSEITVCAESVEREAVWEQAFIIPRTDGGSYPYTLSLSIWRYPGKHPVYEIAHKLTGGVYENDYAQKWGDVWCHDNDRFWNLYFSLGTKKYYICRGKLCFVDHEFKDFTELSGGSEIPYCGSIRQGDQPSFSEVAIGYDRRISTNCGLLTSDRMFLYDLDGTLKWIGKPLDKPCIMMVSSSENKEWTKRIPKTSPDYEDALFHAKTNHYFTNLEAPEFWVDVYSKVDGCYLQLSAELENTWYEKIETLSAVCEDAGENVLANYGYQKMRFHVICKPQEQGVYHVRFLCRDGSSASYEHTTAFEVLDDAKKESPQETAGLPDIYCGDGTLSVYSALDFACIRPDFNLMHYINGSIQTPGGTEERRFWELIHLYHRKLLVWMTKRCLNRGDETYRDFPEMIQNVDYLNYIYPGIEHSRNYYRYDLWVPVLFDDERVRAIYDSFLEEYAEYKEYFPRINEELVQKIQPWGGKPEEFFEQWGRIPADAFEAWVQYINARAETLFKEQWEEIKKLNPNVKRFSYGPYNAYILNHAGAYDIKWYGFNQDSLEKIFEGGFLQFEDYPFACGYQPHKCAWNMATIKLEWKNLRIAPEMYDSFDSGCPDGAVSLANPPMGDQFMHPYQTITQLYEYLYYTAVRDEDGFRYWNDRILQMYEFINFEPEKRYRTLLRAWKIFLDHQPEKPLGKIAYVADFQYQDDRRTADISAIALYNRCQAAMELVHEVNSETGNPDGYLLKFDTILQLQEGEVELLVLPSLSAASEEVIEKLKSLYHAGCALIATGDVKGMEEVFGVRPDRRTGRVNKLFYQEQTEAIYPYDAEFFYSCEDAEEYLGTDAAGAIYRKDRALLINTSVLEIGVDFFDRFSLAERANISTLLRTAIGDFIHEHSSSAICADEKCGVNLIRTKNGDTLLLLADYSPYSNENSRRVQLWLKAQRIRKLSKLSYDDFDAELNLYQKDGFVDGFSVTLRPHEILVFKVE